MGVKLMLGMTLFAAGELPLPGGMGTLSQFSAVAVLAWIAWGQHRELQDLRREHRRVVDTLCERWDGWEQVRHTDSVRLDATLRQMAEGCAATQERISRTGA